jgi:hypothetical protein
MVADGRRAALLARAGCSGAKNSGLGVLDVDDPNRNTFHYLVDLATVTLVRRQSSTPVPGPCHPGRSLRR